MDPNSPIEIASDIRLQRQSHKGSFLVVEGRDDRLFFEKFIDHQTCEIIVANGKKHVMDVVSLLESQLFDGIVGGVDGDLDHIENTVTSHVNILVLETVEPLAKPTLNKINRRKNRLIDLQFRGFARGSVDIEALMIISPAFESMLSEWGHRKKIAQVEHDIRSILVNAAVWIGCVRLYSHRRGFNFKFQGLRFKRCIDIESLTIKIDDLVLEVLNRSQRHNLSISEIIEDIKVIHNTITDEWLISYGKDMVEILTVILRQGIGSKQSKRISSETIKSGLRQSYHRNYFNKTKLAKDCQDWESRNEPYHILHYE